MQIITRIMLLLLLVTSCNRRPMSGEPENPRVAMIPIKIDWSQAYLAGEDLTRATVRVFPHNGAPAYDFVMQKSLTEDIMPLAIGKYSFIVFNQTTTPEDWRSMTFKGADQYSTFEVATVEDTFRGLYTKAVGGKIQKSPDNLALWSLEEFEVTADMVAYTNAKTTKSKLTESSITKIDESMQRLVSITPIPAVKKIHITAKVQNLSSAQKSSGALTGVVGSLLMKDKTPVETNATHIFVMNNRKYDNPAEPKDGTIEATLFIFDALREGSKVEFNLDFLLFGGGVFPTQVFDVTNEITSGQVEINIKVGYDVPIILPVKPITGGSVGVDEWEEIVIPML